MQDGQGKTLAEVFDEEEKVRIPYGHEDFGDDLKLIPVEEPGIFHGRLCGVVIHKGSAVCANCFGILKANHSVIAMMGDALIRICDADPCRDSVARSNAKNRGEGGAGKLFSVPGDGG